MRRDHVHKICTNHLITQQMELKPKLGSKNSWVYTTLADFADEISKVEQLAVKFKTPDDADLFKEKFEQCQRSVLPEQPAVNKVQSSLSSDSKDQQEDLRAKLAPKAGSWPCAVCLINNEQRTTVCVACGASKLDVATSNATLPAAKPLSNFSLNFAAPTTSTFTFGVPASGSTPVTATVTSFAMQPHDESVPPPQVSKAAFFSLPPPVSRSPFTQSSTNETPQFGASPSSGASPFTFKVDSQSNSKEEESTNVFGGTSSGDVEKQPLTFGGFTSSPPQIGSARPDVATTSTQTPPHKCEKCESGMIQERSSPTETFMLNDQLQAANIQLPVELPRQQVPQAKTGPFALQQNVTTLTSPFTSPQSVTTQKQFWQQPQFAPGGVATKPAPFGVPTDGAQQNIWYPAAFALNQMAQQAVPTHSATVTPPVSVNVSPTGKPFIFNPQSVKTSPFVLSQTQPVSDASKTTWFQPSVPPQQPDSTKGYDFKPYIVEESTPQTASWSTTPQLPVPQQRSNSDEYNEDAQQDENGWESDYETESETGSYVTTSSGSSDNVPLSNRQPERPERPDPETAYTPQKALVTPQKLLQSIAVSKGDQRVFQQSPVTGRQYLRARAPLRQSNKPDTDSCVFIYEVRPTKADREKATKLLLPTNFYNYTKFPPCPGCQGCRNDIETQTTSVVPMNLKSQEKPEQTTSVDSPGEPTSEPAAPVFGKTFGTDTMSFSDFARKTGIGAFGRKDTGSVHGFPQAGTQLFGEDEHPEEDNDGIYFEPVMPLPDEVETVTGEEAEEVMFCERAKLYRFDDGTRQWKERGLGNIKLLTNPLSGRSRVVMRREQVLKVCANHSITGDMELKPGLGSDRSWVWHTLADFAESEPTAERLAAKFKTTDTAAHFKDIFDSLKERSVVPQKTESKPKLNEDLGPMAQFAPPPGSWPCGDCLVQNEADNLRCVACNALKPGTLEKQPDITTATASSPATSQTSKETLPSLLPISKFSFGTTTFQPKPETVSQMQPGSMQNVAPGTPLKLGFGFTFGAPSAQVGPKSTFMQPKPIGQPSAPREMKENETVKGSIAEASPTLVSLLQEKNTKSEKPEGFKFAPVGSGPPAVFSFGSGKTTFFTIGRGEPVHESDDDEDDTKLGLTPSKTSSPPKLVPTGTPVNTALPENIPSDIPFGRDVPVSSFTFSMKASPSLPDKKPSTPETPEESTVASPVSPQEPHPEAEDDGIHFEPIIPLPEKIKVRTGEESEKTLFCNRAKLYRYDKESSQWKERGLGEFKILHDPETNRHRILMRREHILKICANHTITANMDLKPMTGSDKSWVWNTHADFADEVAKPETLAVRFKTKEIADEFKQKFKNAQEVQPVQKESPVKVGFYIRGVVTLLLPTKMFLSKVIVSVKILETPI